MKIVAESDPAGTDGLSCNFCSAPEARVNKLIAGDQAAICDRCIAKACALIVHHATANRTKAERFRSGQLACSFCHKLGDEQHVMAGSLRARVCARCLGAILAALAIDLHTTSGEPVVLSM